MQTGPFELGREGCIGVYEKQKWRRQCHVNICIPADPGSANDSLVARFCLRSTFAWPVS